MDTRSEIVSNIPDGEPDREPEFVAVAAAVVVIVSVAVAVEVVSAVAAVGNTLAVLVPELQTIELNHSDLLSRTCEDRLVDTSFVHFDIDFGRRSATAADIRVLG